MFYKINRFEIFNYKASEYHKSQTIRARDMT